MSVLTYEAERHFHQLLFKSIFRAAGFWNGRAASRNAIGFP